MSVRRACRRAIEIALIVTGVSLVAWYGLETARTWRFQRAQQAEIDRSAPPIAPTSSPTAPAPSPIAPESPPADLKPSGLVGRLEIPRLHLSVAVMEGDDDGTLKRAVGHLPDTPLPWA